jgi:hypothetical protein
MAQPIKYNVGSITAGCCIRTGNYDIGVNPNYAYGPTASTGFWAGYPPGTPIPTGGFISYQNKASQGPSIYSIASVNEIVEYGQNLDIGVQNTPEDVLYACANLNTIALVNIDYPEIPTNNNKLTLDAGYTASYPWMNLNWWNVSGSATLKGELTGNTTFVSGASANNYSDSYLNMPSSFENAMVLVPNFGSQLNQFTVNVWVYVTTGQGFNAAQNVVGQQYSTAINNQPQTQCNFLIRGNGSNGFEGLVRDGGTNYTVNFGIMPTGAWRMLTLTYNGTDLTSFVNTNLVDNNNIGPVILTLDNGLQTIIGGTTNAYANLGNPTGYFDGRINVVNIYDRALDSGEISQLYSNYGVPRGF